MNFKVGSELGGVGWGREERRGEERRFGPFRSWMKAWRGDRRSDWYAGDYEEERTKSKRNETEKM